MNILSLENVSKNYGFKPLFENATFGIENRIESNGGGRYLLPDGSERFLVSEELLDSITNQLGGVWLEPLKTTNVQNLRCMTTWVLRKGG